MVITKITKRLSPFFLVVFHRNMGKKANRLKAAAHKGEKIFSGNQRLDELKSRHRQDMLCLMGAFNEATEEIERRHTAEIVKLKNALKTALNEKVMKKCYCENKDDRVVLKITGLD